MGLAPLDDNGGPTPTRLPAASSPAVDAGDPGFAAPPATDQRGAGLDRVSNGRLDIGAVELQVEDILPATGSSTAALVPLSAGALLLAGLTALLLAAATRRREAVTPR